MSSAGLESIRVASTSGLALSPIVAGVWRMAAWSWSVQERVAWIEACLAMGVSSFDHADIYGDYEVEALFGEALAAAPGLRERIQIISKTGIALRSRSRPEHRLKPIPISGSRRVEALRAAVAALALRLDEQDWFEVLEASSGHAVP